MARLVKLVDIDHGGSPDVMLGLANRIRNLRPFSADMGGVFICVSVAIEIGLGRQLFAAASSELNRARAVLAALDVLEGARIASRRLQSRAAGSMFPFQSFAPVRSGQDGQHLEH